MKITLLVIMSALCTSFALKAQEIPEKARQIIALNPEAVYVESDVSNDGHDTLLCFMVPNSENSKLYVWVEISDKLDIELFPYFCATAVDSQKMTLQQMKRLLKAAAKAAHADKPKPEPDAQLVH
jgi:hypothetical protein